MQITKNTHPKPFEPYSLTIYIDTQQEHNTLKTLSEKQWAVPVILYPDDKHSFSLLQSFLNKLYIAIKS
jgi:hypothetical protein